MTNNDTTDWTAEEFADEWIKPLVRQLTTERRRFENCLPHTIGRVHEARKIMIQRIESALPYLRGTL